MESPSNSGPILFLHVPKTAGTATARCLEAVYPGRIWYDYGTERDKLAARTPCPLFVRNRESIIRHHGMIFGHYHFLKYGPLFPDAPVASLVRDPVDRAISHYLHTARYHDAEPLPQAEMVQDGRWDVVAFTELSGLSRNIYQEYFEGKPLADFAAILIQERLHESMTRMAARLGLSRLMNALETGGGIPQVNQRPAEPLPPQVRGVLPHHRRELERLLVDDMEIYREALALHGGPCR